jgi:hypothetical protein
MTVAELIRELKKFPRDKDVIVTVSFENPAVLELVSLAMAHGQEPVLLSADPGSDLHLVPCECQDPTHEMVSIEVCGMCLAGIEHDSDKDTHFEGTD